MPATRPRRSTGAPPMASSFGGDAVNFIRCLSSCRSADNRRGVRRGQRPGGPNDESRHGAGNAVLAIEFPRKHNAYTHIFAFDCG